MSEATNADRRGTWMFGAAAMLAIIPAATPVLHAQAYRRASDAPVQVLARDQAMRHALQHNPLLMTVRKQEGFAEAAAIIAKTYPFNPVYTGYVTYAAGPPSADVINPVYQEHYVTLELEIRGQGRIRRAGADATRNRIEAEISAQEMAVSLAVIRAYNAVLYRQSKLDLLERGIKVNEIQVEKLREQVEAKKVKDTDLMLARADLEGARAQLGQARTLLAVARSDLRRLLGTLDDSFIVVGDVDVPLPSTEQSALTQLALNLRPDLIARRAAICEAEAALNLAKANRYGNPSIGPYFEFDPTAVSYVGARIGGPIPILNTKKGEIHRAETELERVRTEVHQIEVQISQDVFAALNRLASATQWARAYATDVLPDLTNTKLALEKMFANNEGGVDLPRFLTVQRAFLKATENYLDARFEVSQAECDLAQATAEPRLALGDIPPPSAVGGNKSASGR